MLEIARTRLLSVIAYALNSNSPTLKNKQAFDLMMSQPKVKDFTDLARYKMMKKQFIIKDLSKNQIEICLEQFLTSDLEFNEAFTEIASESMIQILVNNVFAEIQFIV